MRLVEFYQADRDYYNDFVASQNESQFLQSWAWGEFQHDLGRKVWRIGFKRSNQLLATAQIISHPLKMDKSYLYIPRGPLFLPGLDKTTQQEILELLLSKLRDICYATKRENEIFVRLEPDKNCDRQAILSLPLQTVRAQQPEHSWLLDLQIEEKDLLKNMHHKTRYNIKLAERKGVHIRHSNRPVDLNHFLYLAKITAARAGFSIWPDHYYEQMLKSLKSSQMVSLWLAEYKKIPLVANLVINFGDTVTYLHGASANKHKEIMAPHLLQWQQIKWAREQGYQYYDFWGVAPTGTAKAEAWQGITRFKQGFGGRPIKYPGSYDFIYSAGWYKLYNFIKKLR
ncbi:MAG: lipid II:glycine glycyltransferase FemX [Candidatus Komeilibacteria bacterium]